MFTSGGLHGLYTGWALSNIADFEFYQGPGAFLTVSGSLIGEYIGFNPSRDLT